MTVSLGRAINTQPSTRLDRLIVAAIAISDITGIVVDVARRTVATPAAVGLFAIALALGALFLHRRTRPLLVLSLAIVGVVVVGAIHHPALVTQRTGSQFVIAVFAVAAWGTHRWLDVLVPAAIGAVAAVGTAASGKGVAATLTLPLAVIAAPWFAGYASRLRRLHLEDVEQRLCRAEADREVEAHRAVAEERARLARELHDVVAHHVSLIGVQAGAARVNLGSDTDKTLQALTHIESSSRAAVVEMRQLLGTLTNPGGVPAVAPAPTLAEFDALCDGYRSCGLDVRRCGHGDIGAVPALQAVTLYRIVEEALTNITRHSTASTCSVQLDIVAHEATVTIGDPGWKRPTPRATEPGSGHGLIGIRQRVELFAGRAEIGPTATGGFVVKATIPFGVS